jgi:hypothetical protein
MSLFKNYISFKLDKDIKGAKSKSRPQGGGTVTLSPPSSANAYQSIASISVLDLIGEGPIEGFSNTIDGTKCVGSDILSAVFYDDTPIKQPVKRRYISKPIKLRDIVEVGIAAKAEGKTTDSLFKAIDAEIDGYEALEETDQGQQLNARIEDLRIIQSKLPTGDKSPFGYIKYECNKTFDFGEDGSESGIISQKQARVYLSNTWDNSGNLYQRYFKDSDYRNFIIDTDFVDGAFNFKGQGDLDISQGKTQLSFETTGLIGHGYLLFYIGKENYTGVGGDFDTGKFLASQQVSNLASKRQEAINGGYDLFTYEDETDDEIILDIVSRDQIAPSIEINEGQTPNACFFIDNFTNLNFNNVDIDYRLGEEDQDFIPNYSSGSRDYGINFQLYGYYTGGVDIRNGSNNQPINYSVWAEGVVNIPESYDEFAYTHIVQQREVKKVIPTINIQSLFDTAHKNDGNEIGKRLSKTLKLRTQIGFYGDEVPIGIQVNRKFSLSVGNAEGELIGGSSYNHEIRIVDGGDGYTQNFYEAEITFNSDSNEEDSKLLYFKAENGVITELSEFNSEDQFSEIISSEFAADSDDQPQTWTVDNDSIPDPDRSTFTEEQLDLLVEAAIKQSIDPQSLVLLSYRKVQDHNINGIIDYPYLTELEVEDLPSNIELRNKKYKDFFTESQLQQLEVLGVYGEDTVFPEKSWKDLNRYIKVKKNQEETESILVSAECALHSVTEYLDANFSYPNCAIVGNTVDARSFSQSPERKFEARMKKISIPSNYFPLRADGSDKRFRKTKFDDNEKGDYVYYGEWDGNLRLGWSDNPAWILYDLITNTKYGVGNQIDDIKDVDIFELYTIGRYCDAVDEEGRFVGLSDGQGGLEPRFSCNLAIDQKQNAFQIIGNVASIFRGMTYWSAGTLNFSIDKPKPISAIFNNENVFDGSFNYSDVSAQNRFTRVSVTYMDKRDEYKVKKEYVDDEEGIRNYGIVVNEMNALGCTSRSQARRLAEYILLSNKMETEAVQFQTDARALILAPGDIVRIDDELKNFEINYGKVLDKSVLSGYIEIDNQIQTGNIATGFGSALYLQNSSFDQNDLRSLYDISQFNNNVFATGESLTIAAINNEDTNNLIAKYGEGYTGFSGWGSFGANTGYSGGANKIFGYDFLTLEKTTTTAGAGVEFVFPKLINFKKNQPYCFSIFTPSGIVAESSTNNAGFGALFKCVVSGNVNGEIGLEIKRNGTVSPFFTPIGLTGFFEIKNFGIEQEIQMPQVKWSRPFLSVETSRDDVRFVGVLPYLNQFVKTGVSALAFPQIEEGLAPTPFNSNEFQVNNFINQFLVTGVQTNGHSNGYRLFLDKGTKEYSTFHEVPIGSSFNLQLKNGLTELYKIIKISPSDNNLYSVEALQHNPDKFEIIENERFVEEEVMVNIGIPMHTVTRPSPAFYVDLTASASLDEFGNYFISVTANTRGVTIADRFRVSVLYPNGTYDYKEVEIGINGISQVKFFNLPLAGDYLVKIVAAKNPSARIADEIIVNIPYIL